MLEALMTVAKAAEFLDVHEDTVLRWIKEGKLRACTLPGGGEYRISEDDLKAALELRGGSKASGPKTESVE